MTQVTNNGQMMAQPLLIPDLLEYAATHHGQQQIISQRLEGDLHSYSYQQALARSKQLANALIRLGVKEGDRIGTLAWNGYRHFECYYAISGIGAICHTINPRLFGEQIEYIVQHAQDSYLLLDACFIPLLETISENLPSVKGFIILIDDEKMPETRLAPVFNYERLIAHESAELSWPTLHPVSYTHLTLPTIYSV